jgi:hypothetical protein
MKTPLQDVKDPTGRVDWLAAKLLEEHAKKKGGIYQDLYIAFKPEVEGLLKVHLGPQNKTARNLRKYVKKGHQILVEAQRRKAEARA